MGKKEIMKEMRDSIENIDGLSERLFGPSEICEDGKKFIDNLSKKMDILLLIKKLKSTCPTMQLYCWCGTEIWAIDGNDAIRYDSDIGAWQGSCLNKAWVVDCCEVVK